jgi:hypothetical protein
VHYSKLAASERRKTWHRPPPPPSSSCSPVSRKHYGETHKL